MKTTSNEVGNGWRLREGMERNYIELNLEAWNEKKGLRIIKVESLTRDFN